MNTICPKCGKPKDGRSILCQSCRFNEILQTLPQYVKTIKSGKELGHNLTQRLGLVVCPECHNERWVRIGRIIDKKFTGLCKICTRETQYGAKHPLWKGHRKQGNGQYQSVVVYPDSPYYSMGSHSNTIHGGGRYVMEHRLVMAQSLGRPLLKSEQVHHINGDRLDNRIENLKLISPHDHAVYTHMCASCNLRKEIRLLKWQIKELNKQLQFKLPFCPEGAKINKVKLET